MLLATAAACGGGGGGGQPAANPPSQNPPPAAPPANKSAGGIWHGISTNNETVTLFVAENGELKAIVATGPPGAPTTNPPGFGSGAILVTGDQLTGAYDLKRLGTITVPTPPNESCNLTGTVNERISLSLSVECTDAAGTARSASVTMGYDSDHERDSSLALIAGTYTLSFRPLTNVLSIDANGTLFGMYDNSFKCTVNGSVALIDPAYNLYRFEWQISACQSPFTRFEGATFSGLGYREPRGAPLGSFIVLLTGLVDGRLEVASVLYQPP